MTQLSTYHVYIQFTQSHVVIDCFKYGLSQGTNARKVISEVYTSFVLQCTVSGNYYVNYQNYQK